MPVTAGCDDTITLCVLAWFIVLYSQEHNTQLLDYFSYFNLWLKVKQFVVRFRI